MANLKEGMINVVDEGTATVVHRDDMKIAAKTGTAQVGTKTKPRQVAWLCGYLPADNPQYAFAVMIQGEDSDNHGLGLDDGLLGGREGGAIASHIFDDIYGPPPNAKERASNFDDYDKAPALAPAQPLADSTGASDDSADKTDTTNAPPANPAVPKTTDATGDDSDATGMASAPSHASARASASTVIVRTSSKNP
jgi:membrane peptidoglycan carboxypeptidase